jgi:hypothetical protein
MATDNDELRRMAESAPMPVNAVALAVAAGLIAGGGLFVATNWLVLRGGPGPGPHLVLLNQYFYGYRVTFLGSLVGFAWAFAVTFLATWSGAFVYNLVASRRAGRGPGATS